MRTTWWPRWSEFVVHSSTAVWYSGEPVMWTLPSSGCTPNNIRNIEYSAPISSGSMSASARFTPFGCPVVPDV